METALQRIIRKTGRRPVECRCRLCRQQCRIPCLGTPEDILRLLKAGYRYFRHLHPDVEIELADLGTLMLKDYDALCGEKRTYYPVRKMAHKRALLENKRKSDNQKKGGNTYEGK